jgi:hypothetical protein
MSFTKYAAEDINENEMKALNSLYKILPSLISPRINAGANRAIFFNHCLGLAVLII